MTFEFATATRIVFGPGVVSRAPAEAAALGRRALLMHADGVESAADALRASLTHESIDVIPFMVAGEPTTNAAIEALHLARREQRDLVIGIGGGSAIDMAKAVATLLGNPGELLDFLEVIGRAQPLRNPGVPCIAIPTTAGTGSEVTRNSVLQSPEHRMKVSLRSNFLLPRLALVDPALTHTAPPNVTASTGLDALTQVLEPFVSSKANPMTDGLCREGLVRAARSLRRAYGNGADSEARTDMALASLFGGLALANAGLGAVHGFAAPIGGMFPAPHGAVCARLLPEVIETNIRALRARQPGAPALARYDEVARLVTGSPGAAAEDAIAWVRALCADLAIPGLRDYGITEMECDAIVDKAKSASSMKGNPIALADDELRKALYAAL